MVGIGQQFEVQAFLGAELLVRVHAVEAHAQHNRVFLGVLRLVHLKVVGFAGAAWGLIFGIEIKDDPLSTVVLQADGRAVLRQAA